MRWNTSIIFAALVIFLVAYFYFSPPSPEEILVGPLNTPCDAQCWQERREKFDTLFGEQGLGAVLQSMRELYASNADFRRWCNEPTRRVGELTYQNIPDPGGISLTSDLLLCDHGFIRGYAEALFRGTQNADRAKSFCDLIEKRFHVENPEAIQQCFYGTGRGVLAAAAVDKDDALLMAKEARRVCETLTLDEKLRTSCVSGIFSRLGNFYVNGERGLRIDKRDPLWVCHGEPEQYRLPCYGSMHRVLNALLPDDKKDNFRELTRFYKRLYGGKNEAAISAASRSLAYEQAQSKVMRGSHSTSIAACRELDPPSSISCIQGFAVGLARNGKPDYQYLAVIDFCKDAAGTSSSDYVSCLEPPLVYLKSVYTQPKFMRLCENIRRSFPRGSLSKAC